MDRYKRLWLFALVVLFTALSGSSVLAAQVRQPVYEVSLGRGITPPAVDLARRALREASAADASVLIIRVGSGGGVLDAAWDLAHEINNADVPVVVWVGPGPVAGGPAGALLLAAADVAAMAPGSTVGFAQPLARTASGFSLQTQQLLVDDVAQELTSWQRARGRNAEWIERAARSGALIDAERARGLDPPLIDLVAATPEELTTALVGREVSVADGPARQLDTLGAPSVTVRPTLVESLTQWLAVPTVAFVLFVLGAIAIYLELANPGVGVPGVSGGVLLIAALYGFVQAEVRPLAVLLLVVALILVGLEHMVLSHGGLTLAGAILLVFGALWLVDPARAPGLGVAPFSIVGTTLILVAAAAGLVVLAVRIRDRQPATGSEALIGQIAEVRRPLDPEGMVFVAGALWLAWTDQGPLVTGELVEVAGIENLRLYVRKVEREMSALDV